MLLYAVFYLTTATLVAASTQKLGINCRGSGQCPFCHAQTSLHEIQRDCISKISDNAWFENKQRICSAACNDDNAQEYNVGVFLQNTHGAPGSSVKKAIQQLIDHGCGLCGSAPFYENDVSLGELTVNVVDYSSCHGFYCDRR